MCPNRTGVQAADSEFRDLCEKFRTLEARKVIDDARANFQQAHVIREARVRLSIPVSAICDALDLSPQSVNTYRNVADKIDQELFLTLIEERRPDGLALFPWSIIIQIARLAGEEERSNLIKEIRLRGWRTRDVEGYVSVERSDAAARSGRQSRCGGSGSGVSDKPRTVQRGAGRDECDDDLTVRIERLLGGSVRPLHPAVVLSAVASAASRVIAGTVRQADLERSPVGELCAARDALTYCAAIATEARDAIERRLSDGEERSRSGAPAFVRLAEDHSESRSLA